MKATTATDFPGLESALDSEAVPETLGRLFPDLVDPHGVESVLIEDVFYRPGESCVLLYRLKVRDGRTRRARWRRFSAQLLREDETPDPVRLAAAARSYEGQGDAQRRRDREPVAYHSEGRAYYFAYPYDPVLPTLPLAMDGRAVRRALAAAPPFWRLEAEEIRCRNITYTPQSRASILYTLSCPGAAPGETAERLMIGKVTARENAAELFADSLALWQAAEGRVGLARPVAYLPRLRLTLQKFVPGDRLTELTATPGFTGNLRLTAEAAAALHALEVPLKPFRPIDAERRFLARQARILGDVHPTLGPRIERLGARLMAELDRRHRADGPVHGDLHSANVILQDDRVSFIDLDQMSHGDTASDIGRFIASMRSRALREWGDLDALRAAREAFLERYLKVRDIDEGRVRLYEAIWLLHGAKYLFEIQWPDWQSKVAWMVAESERIFSRAEQPGRPALDHPAFRFDLPFEQRVRWAMDRPYMLAMLIPHVERLHGEAPRDCAITEKPREDCRAVNYRLRGRTEKRSWKARLTGCLWRSSTGRSRWRRLRSQEAALRGSPGALRPPRTVAHLSQLSMLLVETPRGPKFSDLAVGPRGGESAEALGGALAALHGTPFRPPRVVTVTDRLLVLGDRLKALETLDRDLAGRAAGLFAALSERLATLAERAGPTAGALPLNRILLTGEGYVLDSLTDLALSEPACDAGDVAARLASMSLRSRGAFDDRPIARHFLESYAEAAGRDPGEIALHLSLSLLRSAVLEAVSADGNALSLPLLARAEAALAGAMTG